MRRLVTCAAITIAAVCGESFTATAGAGEGNSFTPGGAEIGVGIRLPGFETPAAFHQDRCAGRDPFTQRKALALPVFQTEDGNVGIDINIALPLEAQHYTIYGNGDVEWMTVSEWSVEVKTAQKYELSCFDPITQTTDPTSREQAWASLVTPEAIVHALSVYVADYLDPPAVSFPARDQEFGWLYVNTAQDIRIESPDAITLTATAANITGTATASITATPTQIVFTPGEPDGNNVACSIDQATAAYTPSVVGCSYRFKHSSAISPTNYFGTRTILVWTVTTSAPSFTPIEVITVSYDAVQVAEIQALQLWGKT